MNHIFFTFALFVVCSAEYVDKPCSRNDPNLAQCFLNRIEGGRDIILKEIDPWIIKETNVDQNLNELVWLKAVIKNVVGTGMRNTIIEDFKVDPEKMMTELRITIPFTTLDMEYDVNGQLLIIPMQSRGHFRGNFTDIKMFFRGFFSKQTKGDQEHLRLEKLEFISRVGDGVVKMISKNPELQFTADLISNFYNENPRRVMDSINPIYTRHAAIFFKNWANDILSKVPASDIIVD